MGVHFDTLLSELRELMVHGSVDHCQCGYT